MVEAKVIQQRVDVLLNELEPLAAEMESGVATPAAEVRAFSLATRAEELIWLLQQDKKEFTEQQLQQMGRTRLWLATKLRVLENKFGKK